MNPASSAAPPPVASQTPAPRPPAADACVSDQVSRPSPAVASAAPPQSSETARRASLLSATNPQARNAAAAAIGRLSRKIVRQPIASTSQPPRIGPSAPRERADRRPGADRAAARLAGEGAAQDGQAVGHQQRRAQPLQAATGQQPAEARRDGADDRRQGEQDQPCQEHASSAEMVTEPAAQQDQRAQRQQVGVDRPGQFRWAGAEIARQRRQGDVDDRAVDEGRWQGFARDPHTGAFDAGAGLGGRA